MTDNSDNDTSVAGSAGAARGVPGGGESPMRAVSCRLSAESPSHRGSEEKYGAYAKRQGTATVRRCRPVTDH